MNPLTRWRARRQLDRDLAEEMANHIRERAEQLMDAGQSAEDADRNARRQFGNPGLQLERSRDAWGWNAAEEFLADFGFGCRLLVKSPGFTATALLTLALAIGATTAVFTVVDSILLRPLSFPDSGSVVAVWERVPFLGGETVPIHVTRICGGSARTRLLSLRLSGREPAAWRLARSTRLSPGRSRRRPVSSIYSG